MDALSPADPGLVFWLLAILHFAGLASMFLARLSRLPAAHEWFQHLFVGCLLIVGCATLFTILAQNAFWVWSGTTFSLMAVGATIDLGGAGRASAQGF